MFLKPIDNAISIPKLEIFTLVLFLVLQFNDQWAFMASATGLIRTDNETGQGG
jgi:hypothetical protein